MDGLETETSFAVARCRFVAFVLIVVATVGLMASAHGQQAWQNPSERYLDAYRAYEDAATPIPHDEVQHFVYFARDRASLPGHVLLTHPRFAGAQIMYPWAELEPQRDRYDFTPIREDLELLEAHGKTLFIQLQDATFSPGFKGVPGYLIAEEFDGGVTRQVTDEGEHEGWVAKRWNPAVRVRFARLLAALGEEFDGRIEGINLQESAIGASSEQDPAFTPAVYAAALRENMTALKAAFPTSTTMQYANFMPGEWLPWEDHGHLRSLYEHGQAIGVGLGAPDLMPQRKGQLNHALALMHESAFTVPLGIAVQDGNYVGRTGNNDVVENRTNLVPMLHAFAREFLKVDYMFWSNQPPYFEQDVLPAFEAAATPTAEE